MKKFSFRVLLTLLVACFTFGKAAAQDAEAHLYIPDFTLQSYDPTTVSVVLDNSVPIAAVQFDLVLPEGLSVVAGSETINPARKANGMQIKYSAANNRIAVFSLMNKAFIGSEGEVLSFKVVASEGTLEAAEELELTMTGISISGPSGNPAIYPEDQTTTIAIQQAEFQITTSTPTIAIKPGSESEVALGLENSAEATGIQFNITLPNGITVNEDSFEVTSRCSQNTTIIPFVRANGVVNVQMINMDGGNVVVEGTEGDIITFKVNVAETHAVENDEIKIDEVVVSAVNNHSFDAGELTIALVNGSNKYEMAMAKVQELRDALEAALATIAEEAPDVKDDYTGVEITGLINSLVEDIEAAYAQGLLNADYDTVMAPVEDIEAAIAQLIADAKAAQEAKENGDRVAQNQAAYQADLDALNALQQSLDHTLATVALIYPSFDATADGEAAQSAINAARQAALEAFEAVASEGLYSYELDPAPIQALIDIIPVNAAYDKATRQINLLRNSLNDAIAQIAEVAPLVKDDFTGDDILAQINALASAVDAAKADGSIATQYDEIMAPVAQLNIAIAQLITDAKAAQAAEVKRRADNETAYHADLAKIDDLRSELAQALAEITQTNPTYDTAAELAAINQALDDAKTAADQEYASVATAGNYTSVVTEQTVSSIRAMIQTMVKNAEESSLNEIIYRAENGEMTIYTLDGRRVSAPVKGQVNIFVDAQGRAFKAIVE